MEMAHGLKADAILHTGKRNLRTLPRGLLLGSTGARLWADYLEPVPGFCGALDFIHKLNIPLLFSVGNSFNRFLEPAKVDWYPSHLEIRFSSGKMIFSEKKFITWDDCAVSCQQWENRCGEDLELRLLVEKGFLSAKEGGKLQSSIVPPGYKFAVSVVLMTDMPELAEGIRLKSGERAEFVIAAACGIEGKDGLSELERRAARFIGTGLGPKAVIRDPVSRQQADYQKWFDEAPSFLSGEPLLDKTWTYRWYILRHNLADPRFGNLQFPLFYEGRSHKMSKEPFHPTGWEFSKMIPLSSPLHIQDAKWHSNPAACEGVLKNLARQQDEDGLFPCIFVDKKQQNYYANYIGWAAYQFYLVHRNKALISEILPALKKQVEGWKKKMGNAEDELLIEQVHQYTGKEYQPSYWYFHDFPKDCFDKNTYTPLKRVDRAVYQYLNMRGVAELCEIVNDADAEKYREASQRIKEDILEKMWDQATGFFYDLHYMDDRKALVKNIVGFYPYWARIADSRFAGGWEHLFSKEFDTACPFPSVSADCPAFQAEGGWQGIFIKGRNGCVWDGPSWPYTNCLVLDALAQESKLRGHCFDRQFGRYLREYSLMHYSMRDMERPYLVEHYNSMTGEALSDEADYNHSYYIDLIIRHVAGLNIENERLVLEPVDIGLDYFRLDRIKIGGLTVGVTYKKPGVRTGGYGLEEGYHLYVNGKSVCRREGLSKMVYNL